MSDKTWVFKEGEEPLQKCWKIGVLAPRKSHGILLVLNHVFRAFRRINYDYFRRVPPQKKTSGKIWSSSGNP